MSVYQSQLSVTSFLLLQAGAFTFGENEKKMKPHFVFIQLFFVLLISNSECDERAKRDEFIRTKIISGSGALSSSKPDEEPFLLKSDSELLHFQLDPPFVYVGGVNVLYQLRSGDLQVVHSGGSAIKLFFSLSL